MKALYEWFWYHTEFWIKNKSKRRPYTYIMRDFYHQNPIIYTLLIAWLIYILSKVLAVDWKFWLYNTIGIVIGHLFWGRKYKSGQQEYPEYNPDKGDKK